MAGKEGQVVIKVIVSTEAPMPAQRLPHGYTNASWLDGDRVRKQYVGDDAGARMRTELEAIRHAADRVPVPHVLDVDDRANV